MFSIKKGRLQTAINVYDWEFSHSDYQIFKFALKQLNKLGNYVSIWGKYPNNVIDMFSKVGLKQVDGKTKFVHLSTSQKHFPENLMLTRIDTDY